MFKGEFQRDAKLFGSVSRPSGPPDSPLAGPPRGSNLFLEQLDVPRSHSTPISDAKWMEYGERSASLIGISWRSPLKQALYRAWRLQQPAPDLALPPADRLLHVHALAQAQRADDRGRGGCGDPHGLADESSASRTPAFRVYESLKPCISWPFHTFFLHFMAFSCHFLGLSSSLRT